MYAYRSSCVRDAAIITAAGRRCNASGGTLHFLALDPANNYIMACLKIPGLHPNSYLKAQFTAGVLRICIQKFVNGILGETISEDFLNSLKRSNGLDGPLIMW